MEWTNASGRKLVIQEGDITRVAADAIVNAANSALAGGGGVDGAIHRAGGPGIMRELDGIRARTGGCPTGGAVATGAGQLPARHVFHAVARSIATAPRRAGAAGILLPQVPGAGRGSGARTIAFPAISTGVYGYPLEEAAGIAIREVRAHLEKPDARVERAIFVLFGRPAYEAYERILAGLL